MSKEFDDYLRTVLIQQAHLLEEGWPYPDNDIDLIQTDEILEEILAADRMAVGGVSHKPFDRDAHYAKAHYKGNFDL